MRLSNRCSQLDRLPFNFGKEEYASEVKALYSLSCQELWEYLDEVEEERTRPTTWYEDFRFGAGHKLTNLDRLDKLNMEIPVTTPTLVSSAAKLNFKLLNLLQKQSARHQPIIQKATKAVQLLAFNQPRLHKQHPIVQRYLRMFHKYRIGTRVLISHCVALSKQMPLENMVGVFCTNVNLDEIISLAGDHGMKNHPFIYNLAYNVCYDSLGDAPDLIIETTQIRDLFNIPAHIEYVVFELLKNSMRATVEYSRKNNLPSLYPVIIKTYTTEMVLVYFNQKGNNN